MSGFPETLHQVILYFQDPDRALQFAMKMRWPEGVVCPRCDCDKVYFIASRRNWECKGCKKHFSVKVGTIMEDSPIGLDKWLCAMWLIGNCKNGISSYGIARDLNVTQKTAWFLLHRIRTLMQGDNGGKLDGEVEVDETFIGGLSRNMHKGVREKRIAARGPFGKAVVMAVLERHGEVRPKVVPNTSRQELRKHIEENVHIGADVFTDAHPAYKGLDDRYAHQVIDHAEAYVRENVHTNGLENFWSLLKRGIKGTYVSIEPFHLFRYVDEQAFRYNNRKGEDVDRFREIASNIAGKRLTYAQLTGKTGSDVSTEMDTF